jgi:hypothetical protein
MAADDSGERPFVTAAALVNELAEAADLDDSGTGKSHLLIGLGVAAAEQGRRVR